MVVASQTLLRIKLAGRSITRVIGNFFFGKTKRMFPKGNYDEIFFFDLEANGPQLKLPFNYTDNTTIVIDRFLCMHGVGKYHMDVIRKHIMENTQGKRPLTEYEKKQNARAQGQKPAEQQPKFQPKQSSVFPFRQTNYWTNMNVEGLSKKLKETNEKLWDAQDSRALNSAEWGHIGNLIIKIRDPSLYSVIKDFKDQECSALKKLIGWDLENSAVVMDLFRVVINHHASQGLFKGADRGYQMMAQLAAKTMTGNATLTNLFYKILGNLPQHSATAGALFGSKDLLAEVFKRADFNEKNHVASLAAFLMNFGVMIENSTIREMGLIVDTISLASKLMNSHCILELDL
jgi:hypothetical protein